MLTSLLLIALAHPQEMIEHAVIFFFAFMKYVTAVLLELDLVNLSQILLEFGRVIFNGLGILKIGKT